MRAFFCFRLEKTFGSDPQWDEALKRMTARSEGIALYAQLLCDMLLDKKTLDCEDFPKGLTGMFTVWFEHYIPDVEEFRRFFRPAICCILGAPGQALPIATLRRVMGWRAAQTNDFLLRLQVLLRRKNNVYGEETVTFDHAFVREWLGSEAAGKFYCPPEDGRALLAEGLYAAFEKDAEGLTCWEAETLADFRNMLSQAQREKVEDSYAIEETLLKEVKKNLQVSVKARKMAESRYNRDETGENLLHLRNCLEWEGIYLSAVMPSGKSYDQMEEKILRKKCAIYQELHARFNCMTDAFYHHWITDYYFLGNTFRKQGKIAEANELFSDLCSTLEKRQYLSEEERYTKELLRTYQYLVQWAEREKKYEKVIEICEKECLLANEAEETTYIIDFYEYLADALYNTGRAEEALEIFYKGFLELKKLCKRVPKEVEEAESKENFAYCIPVAEIGIQTDRALIAALCYYCEYVSSYCTEKIGKFFYKKGKEGKVLKAYLTAIPMLEAVYAKKRKIETSLKLIFCCRTVEALFNKLGRKEEANIYCQKEKDIIEKLQQHHTKKDILEEIENMKEIAEMLIEFKNQRRAEENYKMALILADIIGNEEEIEILRTRIADLEPKTE